MNLFQLSQPSIGTRRTRDQPLSIRPVRCVALPDPARLQQNGATVETAHWWPRWPPIVHRGNSLGNSWEKFCWSRPSLDPPDMKKQVGGQRGVETSIGHFTTSRSDAPHGLIPWELILSTLWRIGYGCDRLEMDPLKLSMIFLENGPNQRNSTPPTVMHTVYKHHFRYGPRPKGSAC